MRTLYLISGLLVIYGCNAGLNENDFRNNLRSLDKITSKLLTLDNLDSLNSHGDLTVVKNILGEDTLEFHKLTEDLKLKNITYYEIGGLEYKFGTGLKYDYEYYMIYSIDMNTKADHLSYPQYLDFKLKKVDINERWTFIKIKESN